MSQADNTGGAAAPDAAAAAAEAAAAAAAGDAGKGTGDGDVPAGQNAGGAGDGSLTVEAFQEAMKNNSEFFKDGKIFGQYTTPDEAAKGFKELSGKVRAKNPEAPETYDFSKVELKELPGVKFDAEHPAAQAMLPVLKELNITQAQGEKLAAAFMKYDAGNFIDPNAELAALGANGKAMVNAVNEHVVGQTDQEKADIAEVTSTAAGIRVLHKLLKGRVEMPIAVLDETSGEPGKSAAEWGREAAEYDAKFKVEINSGNPQHQKEYQRLRREEAKAEHAEKAAKKS